MVDRYSRDSTTGITYISLYELLKYSNKEQNGLNELIETIKVVYPDETSMSRSIGIFRKIKRFGNSTKRKSYFNCRDFTGKQ